MISKIYNSNHYLTEVDANTNNKLVVAGSKSKRSAKETKKFLLAKLGLTEPYANYYTMKYLWNMYNTKIKGNDK